MSNLRKTIAATMPQIQKVLPKHIGIEKFQRVLFNALQTNPELASASAQTVLAAAMKAAQDGLLPDGREAAIVTFKSKNGIVANYMPMTNGILKKIRNSGELLSITSQVIYKEDDFEYWVDEDGEHIKFRPNMLSERGESIWSIRSC